LRFQAIAVTGALHHGAAHGALAGEHGNADHAFMADHGDFRGGAIFHHIQQRHDRRGWKIHVFQFAAILEQLLAKRQGDQFEVFKQGFQDFARQGGQQFVLLGAAVADNGPHCNFSNFEFRRVRRHPGRHPRHC